MAALKAAKVALRKEIKSRINQISDIEKQCQSKLVVHKLLSMKEYKESQRISVYLSMPDEIETTDLLKQMFADGKTCFIPRYFKGGNYMDMVLLESLDAYNSLPTTSWGIKQPREDSDHKTAISTGRLDAMVVPGLAFGPSGERLGRGRGYYDNYFSRHEKELGCKPVTVALAFREQVMLMGDIPCDSTDVQVDKVLYCDDA